MTSSSKILQHKILAVLAWFIFGFCSVIIFTGYLVGNPAETSAQESAEEGTPGSPGETLEADSAEETPSPSGEAVPEPDSETNGEIATDGPTDPGETAEILANEEAGQEIPRGPPEDAAPAGGAGETGEAAEAEATDAEAAGAEVTNEGASEEAAVQQIRLGDLEGGEPTSFLQKLISFLGVFALLFVAWLMSNNRRKVNWRLVSVGVILQLLFAIFIFYVPGGQHVFSVANKAVNKLLEFTNDGSDFIFSSFVTGQWEAGLINFSFAVLPTIIFFSALMTILYHVGVMQKLVHVFALIMQKTMNISGAESTSAAANIFVGQTEAPLVIKPFIKDMTESELMVVMTGGFATVAGGVLAIYVGMMDAVFPDIAGHLIAASVMSAPAALVVAKIMYPELGKPVTMGALDVSIKSEDVNVLDAASRGAAEGLKLALNVGAMLLAFLALVAMVNYLIMLPSLLYNTSVLKGLIEHYLSLGVAIPDGCDLEVVADGAVKGCIETMQAAHDAPQRWVSPMISMQDIFGYLFWPFAWIMGVPAQDCFLIAQLLGEKMVINELVAYASLQQILLDPDVVLSERSIIIATYALCGFANFGSIGIQLGGIGGIAPERKSDLAKIALRAMIGGTLAAFMTATIAGILI